MKLSDLVKIRRTLQNLYPSEYEQPLNLALSGIVDTLQDNGVASEKAIEDIKKSKELINDQFGAVRFVINDYKKYIDKCIEDAEQEYFDKSNQIYQDSKFDDAEYILNRRKQSLSFANEENFELFTSRVSMYNNWKYPALEIRPAFGEFTECIKGCDPLYLADTDDGLFNEIKKKWHPAYQRRLRYYLFEEALDKSLHHLPDNQFGLILGVDYFNFKPLNILENFLKQGFEKLRPGGMFIFTYNNCDLPYAVRNVENKFCCYTPGRLVKQIAKNCGYEIVKSFDQLENISWLELRKPGELTTLRGGQPLAEIKGFADKEELPDAPKPIADPNSPGEKWAAQNGSRILRPK